MSIADQTRIKEMGERVEKISQEFAQYDGLIVTVLKLQQENERLWGEMKALKARMGKKPTD
jgi:DNA anti-recombination protein RmuC